MGYVLGNLLCIRVIPLVFSFVIMRLMWIRTLDKYRSVCRRGALIGMGANQDLEFSEVWQVPFRNKHVGEVCKDHSPHTCHGCGSNGIDSPLAWIPASGRSQRVLGWCMCL